MAFISYRYLISLRKVSLNIRCRPQPIISLEKGDHPTEWFIPQVTDIFAFYITMRLAWILLKSTIKAGY
jgi:hypothetical protein